MFEFDFPEVIPDQSEFRCRCDFLGLSATHFAQLVHVDVRRVKRWGTAEEPPLEMMAVIEFFESVWRDVCHALGREAQAILETTSNPRTFVLLRYRTEEQLRARASTPLSLQMYNRLIAWLLFKLREEVGDCVIIDAIIYHYELRDDPANADLIILDPLIWAEEMRQAAACMLETV